jgi:hypothetical protein
MPVDLGVSRAVVVRSRRQNGAVKTEQALAQLAA